MSFDLYEKGMKVEAIADFEVREVMASPVGSSVRSITTGDIGEVREKRDDRARDLADRVLRQRETSDQRRPDQH